MLFIIKYMWNEKNREDARVLYGAVFPISSVRFGAVRFGAVNRTEPHRRT